MKKISAFIFISFVFFISTPSFSNDKLVGKKLYCDSTKIWWESADAFWDIGIYFSNNDTAIIYYLPFIPELFIEEVTYSTVYHNYISNLHNIEFNKIAYHNNPKNEKFKLDRKSLILKSDEMTAQCKLIELEENKLYRIGLEFEKIGNKKAQKIKKNIQSKNKI